MIFNYTELQCLYIYPIFLFRWLSPGHQTRVSSFALGMVVLIQLAAEMLSRTPHGYPLALVSVPFLHAWRSSANWVGPNRTLPRAKSFWRLIINIIFIRETI